MAKMNVPINLRKLNNSIKIEVSLHLTKEFKFRLWVAVKFMRLAALVLGCGIKFVDGEEEEEISQ